MTGLLLATDLSPHADRALDRAALLAAGHGNTLHVLHVVARDLRSGPAYEAAVAAASGQLDRDIAEAGLDVATIGQQESGLAMRMRFAQINAELSSFAGRMEGLERRAWDLSRRWLTFSAAPTVQWTRDFNLADVEQELRILSEMQGAAMPAPVIAHQQKRIVAVQFSALEEADMAEITPPARLLMRVLPPSA